MSIVLLNERHFFFPQEIAVAELAITPDEREAAMPEEFDRIEIPTSLFHAMPERLAEYRTGRFAAMLALRQLAPEKTIFPNRGADGEPIWPPAFSGSITHCSDLVAAAVARSERFRALGLDSENVQAQQGLEEVAQSFVRIEERRLLDSLGASSVATEMLLLALISGKESVLKCLLQLRHEPDIRDIVLASCSAQSENIFSVTFDCAHCDVRDLRAWLSFDEARVYSSALVPA